MLNFVICVYGLIIVSVTERHIERAVLNIFGPGWTGILENTIFI